MNQLPDFESYGYKIIAELGKNHQTGRTTYQAINLKNQTTVVIKQFRFGYNSDWSGNKAIAREIEVLKGLNHPGIPNYLDSFDAENGLCLVQQYKKATPLSLPRSFEAEEIKNIAIQLLEILSYLQNLDPVVIHRDIKPENILINEQLKVYLVDFGFARIGEGELFAMSSVIAGTPGFMPPEQLLNRTLTKASDLYGLGATLICLTKGINSREIGDLIDSNNFTISFRHLVPQINLRFIEWLEKMVQPYLKNRFNSADAALAALKPLYVLSIPEVKISDSIIDLEAEEIGEILIEKIRVSNSINDTILEGKWEVEPHHNDPPHTPDDHAWISVEPAQFMSNKIECEIRVDTSKLMADEIYERQLKLFSNSYPETYNITINVQTAPTPKEKQEMPYGDLVMFVLIFAAVVMSVAELGKLAVAIAITIAVSGTIAATMAIDRATSVAMGLLVSGILTATIALTGSLAGVEAGAVTGVVAGSLAGIVVKNFVERGLNQTVIATLLLLSAGLGVNLGLGFKIGFTHLLIMLGIAGTSVPLGVILTLEQRKLRNKYRLWEQKQNLIKP